MQNSYKDHFKWGWDGEWFNQASGPTSTYSVSLMSAGPIGTLREESLNAMSLLVDTCTKPIMIAFSGGLDSQIMCLTALELKVPFTALIMHWRKDNLTVNADDLQFSVEFCKKHGVKYQVDTMDLETFLAGDGSKFAAQYGFSHYRMLTQTYYLNRYGDTHAVIVGGGNMSFDLVDHQLVIGFETTNIQQFLHERKIQGTAHFLQYTAGMFLAQVDNPIGRAFLESYPSLYGDYAWNSKTPWWSWRVYTTYVKPLVYQSNWEGLIHRGKQHGFEHYDDQYWKAEIQRLGKSSWGGVNKEINIPALDLINHLRSLDGERVWSSD